MKFTLEIELGNDAALTYSDIAWSLRETANTLIQVALGNGGNDINGGVGNIRDINGNTVGKWEVAA